MGIAALVLIGSACAETRSEPTPSELSKFSVEILNLAQDQLNLVALSDVRKDNVDGDSFVANIPLIGTPEAEYLLERYSVEEPDLIPQLAVLAAAMDDPDYNIYICVADILSKYSEEQISAATARTGGAKFGNLPSQKQRKQLQAWGTLERAKTALEIARPELSDALNKVGAKPEGRPALAIWAIEKEALCWGQN